MSITLFPHQEWEIEFLLARQSGLLASATGTGKTGTLAGLAARLIENGEGPILWVTPKSLLKQSADFATDYGLTVTTKIDEIDQDLPVGVVVITTTQLVRSRIDELWAVPFKSVLVDEVHSGLSNPHQATSRALTQMCAHRRAYGASAEPITDNTLQGLHAIAQALHLDGVMGSREFERGLIVEQFPVGKGRYRPGVTGVGERTAARLIEQVAAQTIRHSLDDVQAEGVLPAVTRLTATVPLSAAARAATRAAGRDLAGLDRFRKVSSASRDAAALVPAVLGLLGGFLADHERVVIFTENFDLLDPLAAALQAAGVPFTQLDGSLTGKKRDAAVQALNAGTVRCLLGTSALEQGLNLQAASALVSVVTSWSPAREAQREGRIRRIGSPHAQVVHVVVRTDSSIEQRRDRRIDAKDNLALRFHSAVGSSREPVSEGWTEISVAVRT